MTLESKISEQIRAEIKRLGGYSIKLHSSAAQGSGEPDILACIAGRMIAVETKRPDEKPRLIQQYKIQKWRDAGATAFVADSVEDFNRKMDQL